MYCTRDSCQILMKLEFSLQLFEKYSYIKFHEIRLVGGESFHAIGRTDMTNLIVAFRNFAKTPKIQSVNVVQGNNSYLLEHSWRAKEEFCLNNLRLPTLEK